MHGFPAGIDEIGIFGVFGDQASTRLSCRLRAHCARKTAKSSVAGTCKANTNAMRSGFISEAYAHAGVAE